MDPELILWELVPFSFVVDWFMPVGDWMEARAFASRISGSTTVTSTLTRETVSGYRCLQKPAIPVDWFGYEVGSTDGHFKRILLERVVGTSISVPLPQVKSLSSIASWQHMANGIALLTQVLTKTR